MWIESFHEWEIQNENIFLVTLPSGKYETVNLYNDNYDYQL